MTTQSMEGKLLQFRVAIVTGSSRGIGAAIAKLLAAQGAFVKSLAEELGPSRIRVNAIAPGVTLTDPVAAQPQAWQDSMAKQTSLRRNAQPEDIAGAVLLLALEQARFITGAYLLVNGGITML